MARYFIRWIELPAIIAGLDAAPIRPVSRYILSTVSHAIHRPTPCVWLNLTAPYLRAVSIGQALAILGKKPTDGITHIGVDFLIR